MKCVVKKYPYLDKFTMIIKLLKWFSYLLSVWQSNHILFRLYVCIWRISYACFLFGMSFYHSFYMRFLLFMWKNSLTLLPCYKIMYQRIVKAADAEICSHIQTSIIYAKSQPSCDNNVIIMLNCKNLNSTVHDFSLEYIIHNVM